MSYDAQIFTLISTLPVAITHRIPARGSSFLAIPLGLRSPFVTGPPCCWLSSLTCGGAHRIQFTKWPCASSTVFMHRPSWLRSQHLIDLSSLTERRYFPPGWKTNPRTQLSWPIRVLNNVPRASHNLIVLSREPVAMNSEEELVGGGLLIPAIRARYEYAAGGANTQHSMTCSCPTNVALWSELDASHSLAVWK